MYKCKRCKRSSEPRQRQIRQTEYRRKEYPEAQRKIAYLPESSFEDDLSGDGEGPKRVAYRYERYIPIGKEIVRETAICHDCHYGLTERPIETGN